MKSKDNINYNANDNSEKNTDNKANEVNEDAIKVDRQALIKQLNILGISTQSLYIILFAGLLNIRYVAVSYTHLPTQFNIHQRMEIYYLK